MDIYPGMFPDGIGTIFYFLWAKLTLKLVGDIFIAACGNLDMCTGLPVVFEGAVQAVQETWGKVMGNNSSDTKDRGDEEKYNPLVALEVDSAVVQGKQHTGSSNG